MNPELKTENVCPSCGKLHTQDWAVKLPKLVKIAKDFCREVQSMEHLTIGQAMWISSAVVEAIDMIDYGDFIDVEAKEMIAAMLRFPERTH